MQKLFIIGAAVALLCSCWNRGTLIMQNCTDEEVCVEIHSTNGTSRSFAIQPHKTDFRYFYMVENADAYSPLMFPNGRDFDEKSDLPLVGINPMFECDGWRNEDNIRQYVDFNVSSLCISTLSDTVRLTNKEQIVSFLGTCQCYVWLNPSVKCNLHLKISKRRMKKWKEKYEAAPPANKYESVPSVGKREANQPFRTDGYYASPLDTFTQKMLFLDDSVFVGYATIEDDIPADSLARNFSKYIRTWRNEKELRWGYCWGTYDIRNDTVMAAIPSYKPNRVHCGIFAFKILNDSTMMRLKQKYNVEYDSVSAPHLKVETYWVETDKVYNFFPAQHLPNGQR